MSTFSYRPVRVTLLTLMIGSIAAVIIATCVLVVWPLMQNYLDVQRLHREVAEKLTWQDVAAIRQAIVNDPSLVHYVYSLSVLDGGDVQVLTGAVSEHGLGMGKVVTVRKVDGTWTIVSVSTWIA